MSCMKHSGYKEYGRTGEINKFIKKNVHNFVHNSNTLIMVQSQQRHDRSTDKNRKSHYFAKHKTVGH